MFQIDSLQNAYKIQYNFEINNPNSEELKKDYQEKEAKLTAKYIEDLKNIEDSLRE